MEGLIVGNWVWKILRVALAKKEYIHFFCRACNFFGKKKSGSVFFVKLKAFFGLRRNANTLFFMV